MQSKKKELKKNSWKIFINCLLYVLRAESWDWHIEKMYKPYRIALLTLIQHKLTLKATYLLNSKQCVEGAPFRMRVIISEILSILIYMNWLKQIVIMLFSHRLYFLFNFFLLHSRESWEWSGIIMKWVISWWVFTIGISFFLFIALVNNTTSQCICNCNCLAISLSKLSPSNAWEDNSCGYSIKDGSLSVDNGMAIELKNK